MREHHRLDTDDAVFFYENEFYPLSSFSAFRVTVDVGGVAGQIDFDTAEHAYHWHKFPGPDLTHVRSAIRRATSAHDAFTIAQVYRNDRPSNWDEIKLGVMLKIIRAKHAQHEYVRKKLAETGDRLLVEDSWRDDFWGWGPNKDGQNALGKLWMTVRAETRA